jgi:hypothetical protein
MGPRIGPAGDGSSGAFELVDGSSRAFERAGLAKDEVGETILRARPERAEEIEPLRVEDAGLRKWCTRATRISVRNVGVRMPVSRVARVGCEVPTARARSRWDRPESSRATRIG